MSDSDAKPLILDAKSHKSPAAPVSGTESDSDSAPPPDILPTSTNLTGLHAGGTSHAPLSSIAERRAESGDESEEDEEEEGEGGWKTADVRGRRRGNDDETVIKSGYLWKKGERRKVCQSDFIFRSPIE